MKAWKQLTSCFHPSAHPGEPQPHGNSSSKQQQQEQQGPPSQAAAGEGREADSVSEQRKEGSPAQQRGCMPRAPSTQEILAGKPGPELSIPNGRELQLASVDADVLASQSGPDGGIDVIRSCAPGLQLPWDKATDWAYGSSISLYDATITAGKPTRSGDPIADCFSIIAYKSGALLAAADGVNWGEPARRAARCAVLGSTQQLHSMLKERHGKEPGLTCIQVFPEMLNAVKAAQALILQQFGTLTTLVLTLVLKMQPSEEKGSRWAAFTLTIGDSQAYVYRAQRGTVQELTYASHAGSVRNTAITDGSLGHSLGDDPDLSNMTTSTTLLDEGDIVFLATDGVTDNFDPAIRKQAKPAINLEALSLEAGTSRKPKPGEGSADSNAEQQQGPGSVPTLSPHELHDRSLELLTKAIQDIASKPLQEVVAAEMPSRFVECLDSQAEGEAHTSPGPQTLDLNMRTSAVGADDPPSSLFSRMAGGSQRTSPKDTSLFQGGCGSPTTSPTAAAAAAAWRAQHHAAGSGVPHGKLSNGSAPLPCFNSRSVRPFGSYNGALRNESALGRSSTSEAAKPSLATTHTRTGSVKVGHGWDLQEPLEQQQQQQQGEQKGGQQQQPCEPGLLTARALVDGLLQHVYKVTEPLRLHAAASNSGIAPRTSSLFACKSMTPPVAKPDLPGKLDHATLVAYKVGDQ